jgi:hypothetical protein
MKGSYLISDECITAFEQGEAVAKWGGRVEMAPEGILGQRVLEERDGRFFEDCGGNARVWRV